MAGRSTVAPAADTRIDHEALERLHGEARHEIAGLVELGVAVVELVTTEDLAACDACRRVVGRLYATRAVPLPPIDGCGGSCACRIAPLFLE